jgi:hypothetical protein
VSSGRAYLRPDAFASLDQYIILADEYIHSSHVEPDAKRFESTVSLLLGDTPTPPPPSRAGWSLSIPDQIVLAAGEDLVEETTTTEFELNHLRATGDAFQQSAHLYEQLIRDLQNGLVGI